MVKTLNYYFSAKCNKTNKTFNFIEVQNMSHVGKSVEFADEMANEHADTRCLRYFGHNDFTLKLLRKKWKKLTGTLFE